MKNYFNYKDKNILIMGGSSGFGAKMALVFNNLGANVVIAARNNKKLKSIAKKARFKKKIHFYKIDINHQDNTDILINELKLRFKFLNVVIYCCGTNIRSYFNEIKLVDFQEVMNTNFISAFKFYKKIFPLISNKRRISRVVNFTSIFSEKTFEQRTSYSTSKAALRMLTKNLALEWAKYNITVNCISPGPFLTEINKPVLKNKLNYKSFCEKIPLNRFGNIDEIVTSVLYLTSDYSSYVNGSEIIIDGGWTIK